VAEAGRPSGGEGRAAKRAAGREGLRAVEPGVAGAGAELAGGGRARRARGGRAGDGRGRRGEGGRGRPGAGEAGAAGARCWGLVLKC
jgi:hypothetical protein